MLMKKRRLKKLQNDDLKQKNQLSGLTWKMLMNNYGASVDELYKLYVNGFYDTFRENSKEFLKDKVFNRRNIMLFLHEIEFFKYTKADEIVRLESIEELNSFIYDYNTVVSISPNFPTRYNWFRFRGYSSEEAQLAITLNINPNFTDELQYFINTLNSPEYLRASNQTKDRIENVIKDYFENTSRDATVEYLLDHTYFLVNENFIIECNDNYEKCDFIKYPCFNEAQYLREIDKAIDSIERSNKDYIIVWQEDFNSINDIVEFILECTRRDSFDGENKFFSNRKLDIDYYNKRIHDKEKLKSQDNKFLDIAEEFAEHSKCVSKKVCSLIVKDGRIISTGLNGTAPKTPNCCDIFDENNFDRQEHHKFSELKEMHAEMSAIIHAAKNGIAIDGSVVYSNLEPCMQCLKNLYIGGISRVVYRYSYDYNDDDYLSFKAEMIENGMEITQRKKE